MTTHAALVPYGWSGRVAALMAEVVAPGCVVARVVRVEVDRCVVVTEDGEHRARAPALPAVGDWVSVRLAGDDTVVDAVAPRWSELARRDPGGRTQVLAADVDLVLVTAPADRLSAARVERETAIAWDSGARPVVVATKCDLAAEGLVDDLRTRLVGVDVVATSVVTAEGLEEVRDALRPDRTAVLIGPSGAGKSSLVNALLGDDRLATAAVRTGDHRGRHTTTVRHLLVVPSGGVLIDTPGLRSLALPADHGGVAAAFPDVEALASACRFGDCRHDVEPDCAVVAAVAGGELDGQRLASYLKLSRELEVDARHGDPLAAREGRRVGRVMERAIRQRYRGRGR